MKRYYCMHCKRLIEIETTKEVKFCPDCGEYDGMSITGKTSKNKNLDEFTNTCEKCKTEYKILGTEDSLMEYCPCCGKGIY